MATLENTLEGLQKVKIRVTTDAPILLPCIYLREIKTYVTQKLIHTCSHSLIHTSSKLETNQIFINR